MFGIFFCIIIFIGFVFVADEFFNGKPKTTSTEGKPAISNSGCLMPFFLILGLLVLVASVVIHDEIKKTPEQKEVEQAKDKTDDEKLSAYVYAVEFVKQRIPSPSTAVFAQMHEITVANIRENLYRVSGYLDAQNRYGAMVRITYTCDVRVLPDRGQCENLQVIER